MNGLQLIDWIVLGFYFSILLGIAWWVVKQKQKSPEDYFLASRNVGWFLVGASIFASNIGSEHLVGLAGTGAESGVAFGHYEIQAWIILMLGWVFVPFYTRATVFTMPEFLERRYDEKVRWFLSLFSLVGYILTKVSVTLYAGGVVFQTLMGINFWTGALIILVITGLYTILGGFRAVVYTEAIQTIILIAGSAVVTLIGLDKIGGWSALKEIAGSEHFNMWKPVSHPEFPWPGILFGAPIVGIWYWCTDQYIVQRALAARNETQARRGTIFAGYLKLLPLFIFIIPGVIAYALSKSGQLQLESSDQAFPTLVMTLLPAGVKGLVAGGLLAALMSSLSSVFNSCSTLFTVDIYEKIRPGSSDRHLVIVGRIATGVVVFLGILWIPFMKYISGTLYKYLQSIQSYISPPILCVFLLGLFSKRINAKGALAALVSGFVLAMLRIALELKKASLSGILYEFANLNFLYFCICLFVLCSGITIIVSLLSSKPPLEKLKGLTYGTLTEKNKADSRASWNYKDVIHSVIILAIVAMIMLYFTG